MNLTGSRRRPCQKAVSCAHAFIYLNWFSVYKMYTVALLEPHSFYLMLKHKKLVPKFSVIKINPRSTTVGSFYFFKHFILILTTATLYMLFILNLILKMEATAQVPGRVELLSISTASFSFPGYGRTCTTRKNIALILTMNKSILHRLYRTLRPLERNKFITGSMK